MMKINMVLEETLDGYRLDWQDGEKNTHAKLNPETRSELLSIVEALLKDLQSRREV